MKFIILVLVCFIGLQAYGQNVYKLDERNGFRDAKFGMKPEEIRSLYYVGTTNYATFFKRKNELLSLNGYILSDIRYYFHQGKLFMISIHFPNGSNSDGIYNSLVNEFGKPNGYGSESSGVQWAGENVLVNFNTNANEDTNEIIYMYMPIMNAIMESKKSTKREDGF